MAVHRIRADSHSNYRKIMAIGKDTYAACALAKLNITLSIGKRQQNGMHSISSIMQTISLHDRITLTKTDAKNAGICGYIVKDNIIAKAVDELSKEVNKRLHCRISVSKSIPIAAGLGGGSSDAAAVLRLANLAFKLEMSLDQLGSVAQRIGNDVSFLLHGGRAMVEGKSQGVIKPLPVPNYYYLIANPEMKLSTREMYALHDKTGRNFTELASELCPDTKRLLSQIRNGSLESGVTGKGPTVFAAYNSYNECEAASRKISWFDGDIFIEKAIGAFI